MDAGQLFALGKTHDETGSYAKAFSYYERANNLTAKKRPFSVAAQRRLIQEIKCMYQEPTGLEPEDLADAEKIPIFVTGMSRSGKTLVESLLSQHETVYAAGESGEWQNAIGEVFRKNSIPQKVSSLADLLTSLSQLSDTQAKEVGEIYLETISRHSPQSRFFVDSTPLSYAFVGMIFRALPAARIVYCHRNVFDNCLFVYFYSYDSGNGYSYDLKSTGAFYAIYQEMMTHWCKLYKDRIYHVHYEELVRNPADIAQGIFEYCGLDYDPAVIQGNFRTDEIGHWKNYEAQLRPLRQALTDHAMTHPK